MLTENDLHGYQKACVDHIMRHPYSGLFIQLGLGKTVCALTAVNRLMYEELEIDSCLVVAPKRVVSSVWEEEAKKWGHLRHLTFSKVQGGTKARLDALKKKADIYLISRDNIAWLCALYGGARLPFDMLILDELSSFKSPKSLRFRCLRQVRPSLRRVVGLTGTPAPNGLMDLWAEVYLLDRGERLGKTITRYRETYFRPGRTNGHVVYSYEPLKESEGLVHEKIKDICISMKAEDYLDMPECTDNYIRLPMPDDLRKRYASFEKEKLLALDGEEITAVNAAGLSNKLLQFANGAVYDEHGSAHEIHDIKLEALQDIIEDSGGQPVLVAWTYRSDRDRIMARLMKYGPRELRTDKDIRDWNEGKIQVLLAHPASAGHGLNLQAGGHIIVWFGQTWSLELYQQFNGRLYRQGQKEHVVVNHLILEGTHDEDVVRALQGKDRAQTALIDSLKARISKYKKYM